MTDHDAIAAQVRLMSEVCECDTDYCRHAEAHDDAPDYDGISAAYLDLYDEVQRLRAERDALISMRDSLGNFWAKAEARAEKAEAERIAEWNKRRDAESSLVLEKAVCLTAEAERDRLRTALNEIASAADGIAHDLQIGPEDEGRDIYDMVLAIRDDASAALKGPEE